MREQYTNEGEAFEIVPLASESAAETDGEWDSERGRSGGRGRGGGAGGPRPGAGRTGNRPAGGRGPGKRPYPTPPRPGYPRYPRGPYWGPSYGGSPYGLMVSDPGGYAPPRAGDPWEPPGGASFEPVDFPSGAGDGRPDDTMPDEEIPPKLTLVLTQKAPGVTFQDAGTLAAVRKAGKVTGPALYIITFRKGGKPMAYVGVTKELQNRIRKHMLCGAVLGVPLRNYRVFVAQPTGDVKKLRAIESDINAAMLLPTNRGETTNQRSELEMEVMGPAWV
ncbi:GIY-YIG nuclease family protein [Pseudoduganella plicata]|nr:GIY-YIG nuclease family protein [Pseudoduganella plicata]QBQ35096.1 GIY-YIG nuclease family protein [Pseudoduganella plicata]